MSDPYKVLGVESSATEEQIKKAYKRLAMQYHPDRNEGKDDKFKEIQIAYDQVKDGQEPQRWTAPNFDFKTREDISDFLRESRFRHQMQISISAMIPLKDAVLGGEQVMRIPVHGTNENVKILIPAGVRNGETIRYPKLAKGVDIIIKFNIKQDKTWEIDGLNLIRSQEVSIWDLIIGTELDIQTINDSIIRVRIPAGTQPGTHMRVKGKGIQLKGNYATKGDMLVRLDGKIPKGISDELLALIRRNKE